MTQIFFLRRLHNNFRKQFHGLELKLMLWKCAKTTYPKAWEKEMRKENKYAYKAMMK